MTGQRYADRGAAGRVLAQLLSAYRGSPGLLVLALPRGGVPVAAEVARSLDATLDVLVVRKVGVPWQPELAMGAIAAVAGTLETVRNEDVLERMHRTGRAADDPQAFERRAAEERMELVRREQDYRAGRPPLELRGRVVVLVDDGLATGASMRAAVAAARRQEPVRVAVAVPVGARRVCAQLREVADEVVCAWSPEPLGAVGAAYDDFSQTSDDAVRRALAVG